MNDYGSRPWRGWTPEQLLEFKQTPKKKRKKRVEGTKRPKQ